MGTYTNRPKTDAKDFVEHLSLEPIDLSVIDTDDYYWILVGVPEGEEKSWVKKFLTYSFVVDTELNGIVHATK